MPTRRKKKEPARQGTWLPLSWVDDNPRNALTPAWFLGGVMLAVAYGIFLRFYALDKQSYWDDEIFTLVYSALVPSREHLLNYLLRDYHPPLYNVLLYGWVKLFGDSEIATRSLSALCGSACVLTAWFYGARVLGKAPAQLLAAFLATCYYGVYFSQETRSYALHLLLATWALLYVLHLCALLKQRAPLRFSHFLLLTVISLLMAYTHYVSVVFLAAMYVMLFVQMLLCGQRRSIVALVASALWVINAMLPWYGWHAIYFSRVAGGNFWISQIDDFTFSWVYSWIFFKAGKLYLVFYILFAGLLIRTLARARQGLEMPQVLLLFFALILLIGWGVTQYIQIFHYRSLHFMMPFAFLPIVWGYFEFPRYLLIGKRRIYLKQIFLVVVTLMQVTQWREAYSSPRKIQYREAVQYLEKFPECHHEPILIYAEYPAIFYYYFKDPSLWNLVPIMSRNDQALPKFKEAEFDWEHLPGFLQDVRQRQCKIFFWKGILRMYEPDFEFLYQKMGLKPEEVGEYINFGSSFRFLKNNDDRYYGD